jgi:hypothetical protein
MKTPLHKKIDIFIRVSAYLAFEIITKPYIHFKEIVIGRLNYSDYVVEPLLWRSDT